MRRAVSRRLGKKPKVRAKIESVRWSKTPPLIARNDTSLSAPLCLPADLLTWKSSSIGVASDDECDTVSNAVVLLELNESPKAFPEGSVQPTYRSICFPRVSGSDLIADYGNPGFYRGSGMAAVDGKPSIYGESDRVAVDGSPIIYSGSDLIAVYGNLGLYRGSGRVAVDGRPSICSGSGSTAVVGSPSIYRTEGRVLKAR
ncbi:hypothetical protein J6590_002908 [Homalodisca vitripennis]|nr:hypothetical protein J6590_002908 [Homalodisca vitripennis]